ncbi:MAG: putative baseplate assembly protein [Candidatus Manganitrophaceae bacterium]
MAEPAPLIDKRSATEIAQQVKALLKLHAPGWDATGADPLGEALIGIFTRFSELTVQRLNQAPRKNLLAFLDLLGASLLPPQPARVPLTFSLAAGSVVDGVVQKGTQAAAPPGEGETEPVLFETEREVTVIAASLLSLYTRDPAEDRYADLGAILKTGASSWAPVFRGDRAIDHLFYLGNASLFGFPEIEKLRLIMTLATPLQDPRDLIWERWDGSNWQSLTPLTDETQKLTRSGTITFEKVPSIPMAPVHSVDSRWLRCRLTTPITPAADVRAGKVRAGQLPSFQQLRVGVELARKGLIPETAFTNLLPVDLGKEFYPFGEKPKFGDTVSLANKEVFSQGGALVTLHVTLINPKDAPQNRTAPIPPTTPSGAPKVRWECWDGRAWTELGTGESTQDTNNTTTGFKETTQALTKSGDVVFRLPGGVKTTTLNGVEGFWIRARLISGHYGEEAKYVPVDPADLRKGYQFIPATFAPPSIGSIMIDYGFTKEAAPEGVVTENDFEVKIESPGQPFAPFRPTSDRNRSLYLGFTLPPERTSFPNRTVSLYFRLAEVVYGETAENPSPGASPRLAWEYRSQTGWTRLTVRDESENFTRSGLVEFLAPADFIPANTFGVNRYWLRIRWESGGYSFLPRLRKILPSTVMATQRETLSGEILGSSDGSAFQTFRTTRAPVLAGQQLEVREPELPSAEAEEAIKKEEGEGAITTTLDATGRPTEIWVRWHPVSDFYGSQPSDRHYVFDHLRGEVRFGDSLNGSIPPRGNGNIRMARYETGGGALGNRPAGAIVEMKTTVPYVDQVVNHEAAEGGSDAESLDSLIERSPREIRHRNRAVTMEDYEDLAKLASPEVVRAKSVPLRNLTTDPLAREPLPGEVGVIIVPRSNEQKPLPSLELIRRTETFLKEHAPLTAHLSVVGPLYIRVDVTVEVALVSLEGASGVEQAVYQALAAFLHPLTGGLDGTGWDFGRKPHRSDFYALIERVAGVDHVRFLKVVETEAVSGATETGRFLV